MAIAIAELHDDNVAAIDELRQDYQLVLEELRKLIFGQQPRGTT